MCSFLLLRVSAEPKLCDLSNGSSIAMQFVCQPFSFLVRGANWDIVMTFSSKLNTSV